MNARDNSADANEWRPRTEDSWKGSAMRDIIVAVDLETTGLDPSYERIIEIGAVKFQGDEILEEWQSLVQPGCPIPFNVTQLTGITDEDVSDAPALSRVLPDLRHFIGDAPILGHNVRFDLSFLQRAGLHLSNPGIDTYVLASVMYPAAPRYNLTALSTMLGVQEGNAHRALDDVFMTVALYQDLWRRILDLPLDTLAEIVRLGQQMPWDGAIVFEAALRERSREVFQRPRNLSAEEIDKEVSGLFGRLAPAESALRPAPTVKPVDVDNLAALIEPGGRLPSALEGYEYRPEQVTMLREVARALNEGRHTLIEAPTGVGKSLAYLIPAVWFSTQNNERVVVSTNTINLQEQLLNKDLPLLAGTLEVPFRAAVLKGRGNYLCPRRLAALRRRGATSPEEMHMLAKILVWLTEDRSGDRGSISLRGAVENAMWRRLSAEDEGCTTERCMVQMSGTCPFYRARRQSEAAHILIVNHALLLSDMTTEGRVLPHFRFLIVDEAHHLEDAVTNSMSFRTDPEGIERQIADLGTAHSGLLGEMLERTRGVIPEGYHETLRDFVAIVVSAAGTMNQHVDRFFGTLRRFLEDHVRIPRNEYTQQVRILSPLRRQPAWSEVEITWDNLSQFTGAIADAMTRLAQGLSELAEFDIPEYDDLLAGINSMARQLTTLHARLSELVLEPDANTIYWTEFQPDGSRISVHAAPLDVGPLVQEHIWHGKDAVVMTSATLRTDETFDYIQERLDAEDVEPVAIDTPFDYKRNTLLYLVDDIPEPSDFEAYQREVERGLLSLIRASDGRVMVLFTSYAQLRRTVNAIGDALERDNITIYDQSGGSSRSQLLEGFVESQRAVLMGTRSFWEGVDVPGEDLSVLVIVRLPFSVPSDPLYAARSELFDNPFQQYAIPETILRFRQGFGRLIRRKSDYGVVAIFDRRVISKNYGPLFLQALPECTVQKGPMKDLPQAIVGWLAKFK